MTTSAATSITRWQYREYARFSKHDADASVRYSADVMRQCRFISDSLLRTPPDPTSFKLRDLAELAYLGKKFYEMGEDRMYETIRFWTMSVAEYLDEYFETDVIKASMSGSGIIGTALGIHSPGTAYVLLHHYMGEVDGNVGSWGYARGGMGAVAKRHRARRSRPMAASCGPDAGVDRSSSRNGKVDRRRAVQRRGNRGQTSWSPRMDVKTHVPADAWTRSDLDR
ncbi:MAG: hypothetical protein U5K38_12750 [Woeseiaceae bacterium]|nr:hypothetical protein [Woeseiaceae bacterium]